MYDLHAILKINQYLSDILKWCIWICLTSVQFSHNTFSGVFELQVVVSISQVFHISGLDNFFVAFRSYSDARPVISQ